MGFVHFACMMLFTGNQGDQEGYEKMKKRVPLHDFKHRIGTYALDALRLSHDGLQLESEVHEDIH